MTRPGREEALRYGLLGHSGLRVANVALGTMTFGTEGWGIDEIESRRILESYAEAGGNFLDTANRYGSGRSEEIVGDFIASDRDRFVVATKYMMSTAPHPNASGSHRKNLVQALEASLRRLGTDYVDVLWVHQWDPLTPLEELVRALDDVVRMGKVLYVGLSDTPAWVVSRAQTLAEERHLSPFVAVQGEYSLVARSVERDLLPMARSLDLTFVAWGALASGLLTGKYASVGTAGRLTVKRDVGHLFSERNVRIVQEVAQVAAEIGATPSQVALSWLRGAEGAVVPIVGATSVRQLDDNLGALDVRLSKEQRTALDAASTISMGFPAEFVCTKPMTSELIYGEVAALVDDRGRR
jgi:aryl-alcohol dehydrogenase-like predicted oxidoreductase